RTPPIAKGSDVSGSRIAVLCPPASGLGRSVRRADVLAGRWGLAPCSFERTCLRRTKPVSAGKTSVTKLVRSWHTHVWVLIPIWRRGAVLNARDPRNARPGSRDKKRDSMPALADARKGNRARAHGRLS